ncbi:MAG: filamentous hemagglutinin N-terminal domain-containing protein [Candidatus Gastranaerophilales bacterium]|nr:filamentous hemagglutinin N-terminal domain-containing protein [Candidatus Gastranaerophilales bacterium]
MKKLTTRMLSAFICIAFTGLQMSFADVLQTGMFADKNVLTGAHIKGHTAGLTKIETDAALNNATLHFNNNTRIDWDKLNVYKNQSLYFKNGNFGVLNNVVGTSISKFAGTIKADSGKIIISNPNGILFQGGKFESLGGLVLTTKDLTALQIDDSTDFDKLNLNLADYGDAVAVVVISDSSNIAAADINIISQGILVDSSTLSSSNANGIVLSTTDGANFVASHKMVADDGSTKDVKFTGNYSLSVANSAITTQDGALKLTSDLGIQVNKADITGDLVAEASADVLLRNGGKITGDTSLVSNMGSIHLNDMGTATLNIGGDLSMNAYYDNYVFRSIIDGSSNLEGAYVKISTSKFLDDAYIVDNAKDGYGVQIISSNFKGLNVNSADFVSVTGSTAGKTSLTSTSTSENNSYVRVEGSNLGTTDITTANGFIRIGRGTNVDGDLTMKGHSLNMGYYESNGKVVAGTLNVTGDLVADIVNTIGYSDTVTAKTISLTTQESSILSANSEKVTGKLIADNITLKADKGEIVGLNANVANGTSDYFQCMINGDVTTEFVSQFEKGQVSLAGGSANIDTYGAFKGNVDLTGDLTINTVVDRTDISGTVGNNVDINSQYVFITDLNVGNNLDVDAAYIGIYDSSITGNATLKDAVKDKEGYGISVNDTIIGGTIAADSVNYINFRNVNSGDATLESKGSVRLTDVALGDTEINTTSSVRIAGDSSFDGDLGITSESLVLGYYETDATLVPGSINVAGTLDADINGTIGYSSVVTADAINLTSKTCSIVEAKSDAVNGKLVSDNINLSAHNGVIVQLDGNAANGTSDYYKAVTGPFTGENMVEKIGKTVDECGPISVASKTENGDLNLTIDTSVINVNSDAGNTTLKVATDSLENLTLSSTGDITLNDITVKKPATDTNDVRGNVNLNSENGSITMNNIIADTDITAKAGETITAKGLTADADGNGVGDISLAAKNINVDGATGSNITTESSVDTIIKNVTGADDVTITTGGNAVVENVIADGNKDNIGDLTINSKGNAEVTGSNGQNVTIAADKDATVTDVKGADDVTITTGGNVIADQIIADANGDGIGDLTINGKGNVEVGNSQGENVDITSGVDAIVKNVTGADDVTITTGGNAVVENVIADGDKDGIGDLTINGQGNVDVTGGSGENVTINGNGDKSDVTVKDIVANNDVDIKAGNDVNADDVKGNNDVKITAGNDVNGKDLIADADGNGKGDLIINGNKVTVDGGEGNNVDITGKGDVEVKNIDAHENKDGGNKGGNVTITSEGGNVTVNPDTENGEKGIHGDNDVIINAKGDVDGKDLIADADKNGKGDLIINGDKVTVDGGEGNNVDINAKGDVDVDHIKANEDENRPKGDDNGNVNITSENGDINANDVDADNDINIEAKDGDVTGTDLIADADNDGEGDLNISGNNVDLTGGEGNNVNVDADNDANVKDVTAHEDENRPKGDDNGNVNINAGNDVNAEDVNADNDINIDAGNDVTGKDLNADKDDDGHGDLNINAGGNVDLEGGSGKNVDIDAGGDVDGKDITAGDDINIDAGGDVTVDDLTADDDNDGKGSININAGGKVDIGDTNGKVIVNGIDLGDNGIVSEVLKALNNLSQSGVSTAMAQSFTPIAFAADDDDDEQSVLAKKIAKTVFRTEDGTVSITDRFNTVK